MVKHAIIGLILLGVGFGVGRFTAARRTIDLDPLIDKLDAISTQADKLAKTRCLTVNTANLDLTVYEVPRLGVAKLPPPPPKREKPAEVKVAEITEEQ